MNANMAGYRTVSTNDLDKAVVFYAAYFRDLDGNKPNAFYLEVANT